ncbi:NUDIX hydrolase [Enterovirga sp.]|uniref:NUDIX hydrolase n=1 Tax=Enterovirga sp. TaxID=2026350 RepID=UPI0026018039|nr:NUDIX hydrolase [Enterovirga sp.]
MGRRHDGHRFMPGKFVFPGGRFEPSDRRMPSATELRPETAARLTAQTPQSSCSRGRALALTAIRETYEETGLLIGRPAPEAARARAAPAWQPFLDAGLLPDLAPVTFLGRAVTPPRRPKRFDTRFFVVERDSISREEPGFVGPDKELVELVWVELQAAQQLDLPRITSIMLQELEHRIDHGLADEVPAPFYLQKRGRFVRELL